MNQLTYYHNNDMLLKLDGLKDENLAPITTATVTGQFYSNSDVTIGSPVSLTHVSGGDYKGNVPDNLPTSALKTGYVTLDITVSGERIAFFRIPVIYTYRRGIPNA